MATGNVRSGALNHGDYEDDELGNSGPGHARDEATTKNPIHNRMRSTNCGLSADDLRTVTAKARDAYHSFIAATIGRRYRRPPIYLVDDWVCDALGMFVGDGNWTPEVGEGMTQDQFQQSLSSNVAGFDQVFELFDALADVQDLARPAGLLALRSSGDRLNDLCLVALTNRSIVGDIAQLARTIAEAVTAASQALAQDLFVRPHIDRQFAFDFRAAVDVFLRALDVFAAAPVPAVPGVGFGAGRPGGVLFGSIPQLAIEGPCVLVAPGRIGRWIIEFSGLDSHLPSLPWREFSHAFGLSRDRCRILAFGLANVIFHELTHAMLFLPKDSKLDPGELLAFHASFYRRNPAFEEGLCNAVAAILSGALLVKVTFGLSLNTTALPRLDDNYNRGRYGAAWRRIADLMEPTWRNYHGVSTEIWLRAWEQHQRDFNAFAGVIALYAANPIGLDWQATEQAFVLGQILTQRSGRDAQ